MRPPNDLHCLMKPNILVFFFVLAIFINFAHFESDLPPCFLTVFFLRHFQVGIPFPNVKDIQVRLNDYGTGSRTILTCHCENDMVYQSKKLNSFTALWRPCSLNSWNKTMLYSQQKTCSGNPYKANKRCMIYYLGWHRHLITKSRKSSICTKVLWSFNVSLHFSFQVVFTNLNKVWFFFVFIKSFPLYQCSRISSKWNILKDKFMDNRDTEILCLRLPHAGNRQCSKPSMTNS